jgi:hypothetical protein
MDFTNPMLPQGQIFTWIHYFSIQTLPTSLPYHEDWPEGDGKLFFAPLRERGLHCLYDKTTLQFYLSLTFAISVVVIDFSNIVRN